MSRQRAHVQDQSPLRSFQMMRRFPSYCSCRCHVRERPRVTGTSTGVGSGTDRSDQDLFRSENQNARWDRTVSRCLSAGSPGSVSLRSRFVSSLDHYHSQKSHFSGRFFFMNSSQTSALWRFINNHAPARSDTGQPGVLVH
jgi:hypothetical protein